MKKFWLLTKVQLKGSMNPKKILHMREDKKTSLIVLAILAAFLIVLFGGVSGIYAFLYGMMLEPMGALHLIPAMWMAITCIITLFTTIYKVKGTLFSFSDYDMVMSMPVSTSTIVASRITVLYLYDLLFTAVILIPGNVVYGVIAGAGVGYYVLSTILTLFVPMVPILIGTLIGLLVTIASAKFRYSNIVTIVLMLGLFCAYMVFTMQTATSENPEEAFANMAKLLGDQIYSIYPIAKLYVEGMVNFKILSLIGFLGISILLFVGFCYVVGKGFKKLNTKVASSKSKSNYKMKELKTSGVVKSLYQKEIKRYFASPMYVMNSAVGILLLTIASIVFLIAGEEKLAEMLEIPGFLENIAIYASVLILICVTMTCSTAATISLEGKNLWLLKSLPVTPIQVFLSKAMVNLTITVPLIIIDAVIFAIRLRMTLLQFVITLIMPCAGACFISLLGLVLNLMFPRFDWKSEMEVVKQGMPTMLALLIGMAIGASPIGLILLLPAIKVEYLFLAFTLVLSIITVGIYKYLATKGSTAFSRL